MGHVLPLLPLALELRACGHQLRWVAGPGGAQAVMDQGIETFVAGMPEGERQAELARRYPEMMSLPPSERQVFGFPKVFGGLAAPQMAAPVRSLVESWRPDVVVHDAAELAAPMAAAAAEIPSV